MAAEESVIVGGHRMLTTSSAWRAISQGEAGSCVAAEAGGTLAGIGFSADGCGRQLHR